MKKNIGILDEIKRGIPNRFEEMNPFHFENSLANFLTTLGIKPK